jgi:hypothetical protein
MPDTSAAAGSRFLACIESVNDGVANVGKGGTFTLVTDSRVVSVGPPKRNPYGPETRRLVYASTVCALGAAAVLAATVGSGWSWLLFAWGAVLGVIGAAGNEFLVKVLVSVARPDADGLRRMRLRRHDQRLLLYPASLGTGLAVGTIAAALQDAWPDVLMTVAVLFFELALPIAMISWIKRRAAATRADVAR